MKREEVIKFLENPKSYSPPVKKVKHLQTYISDIFLTGQFAYKIKKPVNYTYLDFTTLAKRKFYCYQELKLNRRLSPEMYLDVLPISRKNSRLKFGNEGKVVEYVLKMKEIPQKYIMSSQIKKGKIKPEVIDQIAKMMAQFHKKARTSNKISRFGSLKIIRKNWQENFSQTKDFIDKMISLKDYQFIKKSVEKFITKNKTLFWQRIKNKKIRDCHGDLHSGNIFVTPKKIFIFDCLEFNERFRYQDTLSEIAFLSMDLDLLNRQDLANYFVKRYIDYSGDKNFKKLLLFYKCYRAYVRGKVCGFHFKNKNLSQGEKIRYKKIAQKFFKLALYYAQAWQKPILLIGAGLPGIGKSRRLYLLAKKIKATVLDTDVIRKEILKKINYSEKSKIMVYREMIKRAERLLKSGQSVILDGTFSKEKYRRWVINLVKKLKVPYYFIEFYCSCKVAKQRLKKRAKEKKSFSEADWLIYQKIKKEFEPIKNESNYFRISTTEKLQECLAKLIKNLNL